MVCMRKGMLSGFWFSEKAVQNAIYGNIGTVPYALQYLAPYRRTDCTILCTCNTLYWQYLGPYRRPVRSVWPVYKGPVSRLFGEVFAVAAVHRLLATYFSVCFPSD